MDYRLELVTVPVSDIDRAKAFYTEKAGFNADHDHRVSDEVRFVQLTPPGSPCSIAIGSGLGAEMAPGTVQGLQLVVADAYRAREQLLEKGIAVGDIDVIDERDGGTLFGFSDPDGNSWVVQQIKERADKPLLPHP